MQLTHLTAAAALIAVSLSACSEHGDGLAMSNPKICASFNTAPTQGGAQAASAAATQAGPADAATPVDNCVRRWAYSLAGARDSAEVVAQAAVAACTPALTRWNQAGLDQQAQAAAPGATGAADQGISLVTGQATTPFAEHSAFASGHALLYVVQARAGRCAPPPVTNGAPAGA